MGNGDVKTLMCSVYPPTYMVWYGRYRGESLRDVYLIFEKSTLALPPSESSMPSTRPYRLTKLGLVTLSYLVQVQHYMLKTYSVYQ